MLIRNLYSVLFFCFIAVLCLPLLSYAQDVYDGQVINKVTELPIPGVTVILLKEKIATQTNERGYFSLESEKPVANDTLQFSSVGYKTFKLPVSAYQPQMFILLEASNTQLNEVRISNSKVKSITLGKFSYYDLKDVQSKFFTHLTHVIISQAPLAKLLIAPKSNAVLTNIALGREDLPQSPSFAIRNKFTMFLVHVMAQDSITGTPGKILFTKTIVLTDNSKWVDIDMTDHFLIIPGSKFFIAIEWMTNPYNEIIGMGNTRKVKRTTKRGMQILDDSAGYSIYYQPFLIGYENEDTKKPATLYTKVGDRWQLAHEFSPFDIALSATVHY